VPEAPVIVAADEAATRKRLLTMSDATGVAEAMIGLPGFRVLDVAREGR